MVGQQSRVIRYGFASLLVLMACSAEARAQTSPPGPAARGATTAGASTPVSCGLLIGFNSASLTFPPVPADLINMTGISLTTGRRAGFVGGLVAAMPAGARVAFETGLLASVRGATLTISVPGAFTGTSALRVIYLDVPLHARVMLGQSGRTRTFLIAGPTVGFKLHARSEAQGTGILGTESAPVDVTRMDFGAVIGARIEVGPALIDVRYTHGLHNVAPESGPSGETLTYRVVSIMGGWRFGSR
jgi:hypothetical protein